MSLGSAAEDRGDIPLKFLARRSRHAPTCLLQGLVPDLGLLVVPVRASLGATDRLSHSMGVLSLTFTGVFILNEVILVAKSFLVILCLRGGGRTPFVVLTVLLASTAAFQLGTVAVVNVGVTIVAAVEIHAHVMWLLG